MRVLHVAPELDPAAGGLVEAVAGMAIAQRGAGLEVAVAATFVAGFTDLVAERMSDASVAVHMIGPASGRLRTHPDIDPVLEPLVASADVVHVHGVWEQIQHRAARLARRRGIPYIASPHGMLTPWTLRQNRLIKKVYLMWRLRRTMELAAAIHCTTTAEQEAISAAFSGVSSVVETLGLDLDEFTDLPEPGLFRSSHRDVGDRKLLLYLGRLHPKKGFDLLIPAFAGALGDDCVLVIAGPDDGSQQVIEALADSHGVAGRVILTGMLDRCDRITALVDADLFVLPSYDENFGIAVIEALATGTPVIISDQVGVHSEIGAAGAGTVVPPQIQPLAGELRRWMSDENLRREAAQRARPFAFDRYDWRAIGRRWREHYAAIPRTVPPASRRN